MAKAIDFSRATSTDEEDGGILSSVVFSVEELLKGSAPGELVLSGVDSWQGGSPADDFSRPRPGALRGSCIAFDYRRGHLYLLFLTRGANSWQVLFEPFARVNEEVESSHAPWVEAIRHFVRIQRLDGYETQTRALLDLAAEERQRAGGKQSALIADIKRHLSKPTEAKPPAELKRLFESSRNPQLRSEALQALLNLKNPLAKELYLAAAGSGSIDREEFILLQVLTSFPDRQLLEQAFARVQTHRQGTWERNVLLASLVASAEDADSERMLKLLKQATNEEAAQLAPWFKSRASTEAIADLRRRIAGREAKEWKLVPELAALGDPAIVAWAESHLENRTKEYWIVDFVLARSPLERADTVIGEVIAKRDFENLTYVVQGYEDSEAPHRLVRLREIVAIPDLPVATACWLRNTLAGLAARGAAEAASIKAELLEQHKSLPQYCPSF